MVIIGILTVLNFLVLSLVLFKVKVLEKDLEKTNTRISSMTNLLKGAYLRKNSRS